MIIKKVTLNPDTPDEIYTEFGEMMQEDGVFKACGNPDNKWVMGRWKSEEQFNEWMNGFTVVRMDKVYIFWYNPCVYEGGRVTVSIHKTHEGAVKAMRNHREDMLKNFVEMYGDDEDMSFDDYCSDKRWGVTEIELLD